MRTPLTCPLCGRPKLLDSFAGQGGAGEGYMRAGFCVDAVDTNAEHLALYPRRCAGQRFVVGDALEFIVEHGHEYAVDHASPTCTGYSQGTVALPDRLTRYDRLIGVTREALEMAGRPYVIENVYGARKELRSPLMLCGRMFGLTAVDEDGTKLTLDRHRVFESNIPLAAPKHQPHGWVSNRRDGIQVAGAYGAARRDKVEAREERHGGYVPRDLTVLRNLLGIDWMDEDGLFLSIPPAYTEHLGAQFLEHLAVAA
jgi:DNA (cytosine-5)-methyltransferase 1